MKTMFRKTPSLTESTNTNASSSNLGRKLKNAVNSSNVAMKPVLENLLTLIKTEIIWKKKNPLSDSEANLNVSDKSQKNLIRVSKLRRRSPSEGRISKVRSANSNEDSHKMLYRKPLARCDSEGVEEEMIAKVAKSDSKCNHEETKSNDCCSHCLERRYQASRMLIDNICDNIEKHLVTDAQTDGDDDIQAFSGKVLPSISLNEYMFRCVRYMDKWFHDTPGIRSSGMQALICSLIYVNRLKNCIPDFKVTKYNVHRLLMVTMLISAKFMQDKPITNKYWCKVGGIDCQVLNNFETLFCQVTEFNLFVTDEELDILYEEFA